MTVYPDDMRAIDCHIPSGRTSAEANWYRTER